MTELLCLELELGLTRSVSGAPFHQPVEPSPTGFHCVSQSLACASRVLRRVSRPGNLSLDKLYTNLQWSQAWHSITHLSSTTSTAIVSQVKLSSPPIQLLCDLYQRDSPLAWNPAIPRSQLQQVSQATRHSTQTWSSVQHAASPYRRPRSTTTSTLAARVS